MALARRTISIRAALHDAATLRHNPACIQHANLPLHVAKQAGIDLRGDLYEVGVARLQLPELETEMAIVEALSSGRWDHGIDRDFAPEIGLDFELQRPDALVGLHVDAHFEEITVADSCGHLDHEFTVRTMPRLLGDRLAQRSRQAQRDHRTENEQ